MRVPDGPAIDSGPIVADPRWGLGPPLADVGGRLQPVEQTATVGYARVLPGEPGLQKLEFESGFAKPTRNGDWAHDCVGRCFAWRGGQWSQVWQTDPIDMLFAPYPIVGDFDGDGAPEVAILPWQDLLVLDARTGKLKDRCRFTDGRSYGFFGAFDLDGDGCSEFVVQADFAKHVDVLGYRNGRLALLWRREIETDISNPQKVLRVHPRPAADVDGDGRMEVLVSLWNAAGDGRWHLGVHDGITGALKAEIPDEYLHGVLDVNGDGACELLTVGTTGAGVPDVGRARVYSLRGGGPKVLWQMERAGWQTWEPVPPPNVNTGATLGRQDALCRSADGQVWCVIRREAGGESELALMRWEHDGFRAIAALRGRGNDAIALGTAGEMLVRHAVAQTRQGVAAVKARTRLLGVSRRNSPAASVAIARRPDGRPNVLAQGALGTQEVVAFRPPSGARQGAEIWRVAGRGQGDNWPYTRYGPVVADLSGGGRQHVYAAAAPSGCARLVAADLAGRTVWHHDFPEIPGTPPVWNTGGIVFWQAGHFTDASKMDVLVTVRRSMMHSEETCLLSGRNGKELWRRKREVSSRGVGGTPFAVADFDGDGLDDCASLHPSTFYILDGATGRDILAKDASWPGVPAQPVYWGIPVAGDFEGNGRSSVFFGTNRRSMTGLVRSDGSLAWWDALDRSPACLPAFGDFTGSGRLEAIGVGYDDGIRCCDAATGKVLWRMPNPVAGDPIEMASADIDSDGRDEALFCAGTALYCVGTAAGPGSIRGELRWSIGLPATLGPPVVGAVGGEGASILVAGADGWVYCVR